MKDPWIATFVTVAALFGIAWLAFIVWAVITLLGKI